MGLIGGSCDEFWFGEWLFVFVLSVVGLVLLVKWCVNFVLWIVCVMFDVVIDVWLGV